MHITHTNPDNSTIAEFRLEGSLDTLDAQQFKDAILPVLPTVRHAILDCTAMPYLTSTGLRAIMTVGKTLHAGQGRLILCGMDGLAKQIYTSSGFTQVFPLADDLQAAYALLENVL